ncbi:MAG: bifunctional phosphoribosylaminoimidazolecarboxamide formyltransferase/IMP cyclohydrolase [Candidatus Theseobacter exili]|nr:bifunctional phosphoribosylaminoimidazolecarboxamide formyltransferase/IMP cyclohydrolase [Candidatus Theseobacter exili]
MSDTCINSPEKTADQGGEYKSKKIERALISVSDKRGIAEFAKALSDMGVKIVSTGGTASMLKEACIPLTEISDYTGFPEMLDGRVKTLHPKVHGGLLGRRDKESHKEEMRKHEIPPIDMVVVNLYPFEETISKQGVMLEEAIENIDIGGPSMLRSASKNYRDVAVVTSPSKYELILSEMRSSGGRLSEEFKFRLAAEAFAQTSRYDALIANYLNDLIRPGASSFPHELNLSAKKAMDLRYGENPHQKASFYIEKVIKDPCVSIARKIHGKELSFNNIIDLDSACEIVKTFSSPTAVVIKHTNPCGAASGSDLYDALVKAWATDPMSAFGSIVGLNRIVDRKTAMELSKYFIEAIIAPEFSDDAVEILTKKKNIRLMVLEGLDANSESPSLVAGVDVKKVVGGVLMQDRDMGVISKKDLKVVTKRKPSDEELNSLLFAWKIVKHVKSNAIVYAKNNETLGIGAGQMSRVDSSRIAIMKAQKNLKDSVLASDAFFPFRDGVDEAAKAGVVAIIQPGGSVRDQEVIDACDENGITMVFTGMRHFKH